MMSAELAPLDSWLPPTVQAATGALAGWLITGGPIRSRDRLLHDGRVIDTQQGAHSAMARASLPSNLAALKAELSKKSVDRSDP